MLMVNFQDKKIFYTLNEYKNNYNILLNNYLKQHEDFDELMFLEVELQFYSLCYDNSNVVIGDLGYGPQYCINGGHCEVLIPEINEAISLSDGYDLDLSTKYNSSFYKILKFLIDKRDKASIEENRNYNPVLNSCSTPEIKDLFIKILHENFSLFSSINQIKNITTSDTYDLFLNEFNSVYKLLICEFMFHVNEDDIKEAIEIFNNSLEFIYADEEELSKINTFIRVINNHKTVYNVAGLSFVEKEKSEKLVYLNNLMIDYYNDFFAKQLESFENISNLRTVYNYLNKSNGEIDKFVNVKNENVISSSNKTENDFNLKTSSEKSTKKIGDKWHALLYLFEVIVYDKKIPTSADGTFIRTELEEIGKARCKNSGQGFYRNVRDFKDIFKDKYKLKKVLNDDWREVIIELSKYDKKIINHLDTHYK